MRSSRNWAAMARLICAGWAVALAVGVTAPAMAQEGLEKDFGIIKACADDIWRLCASSLPFGVKSCMQDKMGQLSKGCLDNLLDAMAGSSFKICKDQTYALCAAARCNVFDGVAYCQCEVKHGDSISLPFPMGKGEDVCSVNAAGANNKYMVSTYSLPEQIASPKGGEGVYTCSSEKSDGAYAQCDGGLCFQSTGNTTFPGFDKPLPKGQIICSCPITQAKPRTSTAGYQIMGPYPCEKSWFKYCQGAVANSNTGSTIYVGAPIGAVAGLAASLNGKAPPHLNDCGSE
ncbi:MAG: hypothetical protein ACLQL2_01945 [Methylovirgula sp.]